MMADAKHVLDFLEGGVGMFFNVSLKFLRIEFAPMTPALFWGQRAFLGGDQIPVNGTSGQRIPSGGLGLGAAALNEFHHPFPQVQCISFHVRKPVMLCPNVNMKCYILLNLVALEIFKGRHIAGVEIKSSRKVLMALSMN
jgi:hypothetical protein